MAKSGANGKWDASIVTDNDILKLKHAGYLSADIAHQAPEAGQIVPTPRPGERVVFLPHFLMGLGFPLHPICVGVDVLLRDRFSQSIPQLPPQQLVLYYLL